MANKHTFIPNFLKCIESQLETKLTEQDELEEVLLFETQHIVSNYITHILQAKVGV